MNLDAFANIQNLGKIVADNGIYVPRLRGYELMIDKERTSREQIQDMLCRVQVSKAKAGCRCGFTFRGWYLYGSSTDAIVKKYMIRNPDYVPYKDCGKIMDEYIGVRWDRIHGKKRKALKFAIKKQKAAIIKQTAMWNKYCGRADVLYAHSRTGGGNWPTYAREITSQDAYIEHVDDWFDNTYCDIYFRLKAGDLNAQTD